ncbi:hypothetical protein Thein_0956 [Thermodesulfatator indicus DSM 15286]|uniref:Calcineurin-like phosphoesterase domain-containing protein n=1 Tax=Thermodesulfatator indicus (strain DSM 15286 / JCM 11887 / CIR29812) TaxID=667014 RepID=F8A8Q1_THEID|nr:metallophosphoesterase [Thermodesulfatator indicus]AEH44830.1 hypothetical protein Thein_0956 [Thermodesulfatator indicus DSM 15286]
MSFIKYIVLSDLHLGEEDSLLTNLKPGVAEEAPLQPSPVLVKLGQCFENLLENDGPKPELVILGDGLEMALAGVHQAAMAFERLIEEFFIKRRLFSSIIYVPGNHDHHLWETAREIQYSNFVERKKPPGEILPEPWHISETFPQKDYHFVPSPFLQKLINRYPEIKDLKVKILYPVFGLLDKDYKKIVCLHHGHLIESIYRLMSKLKVALFPSEKEPDTLNEIEKENFAWIDFFWSTMGRSGRVGEKIENIYEMLLVPATFKDLLGNLAKALADKFDLPLIPERWEDDFIKKLLENFLRESLRPERRRDEKTLSESSEKELRWFVESPILHEIKKILPVDDEELSTYQFQFVFGHTHKPLARLDKFRPFNPWAKVFNTGGWVIDRLELLPVYGVNLILITDDLEVIGLELFRQGSFESPKVLYVKSPDEQTPLIVSQLNKKLGNPIWQEFVEVVQSAAQVRAGHLRRRLLGF